MHSPSFSTSVIVNLQRNKTQFRSLLWQVSSFTLAHTLTLGLGIYGVIQIPAAIVGVWFHRRSWYRQLITIPFSLVIASVGGYWFLEWIGVV
ncbi:MAG: HupE/UreJ family protein [Gammaproteobacteria bacterium]|nr:HupE/UreJ family protein [Gammaproteobacteria bacterium]